MPTRYHINLPDPQRARGTDSRFAFQSQGAQALAQELQDALRSDGFFQRWQAAQEDPDDIDSSLGATDPAASVQGSEHNLHVELIVTTALPGSVFKHRLRLLAGNGWELRDVSNA